MTYTRAIGWICGKIINVSDANRSLAVGRNVAHSSKHITIHNGIGDNALRARPSQTGVPRIIMLARFAPQKAQALLVEAVRGISKPFELIFVGDGPTRPGIR